MLGSEITNPGQMYSCQLTKDPDVHRNRIMADMIKAKKKKYSNYSALAVSAANLRKEYFMASRRNKPSEHHFTVL